MIFKRSKLILGTSKASKSLVRSIQAESGNLTSDHLVVHLHLGLLRLVVLVDETLVTVEQDAQFAAKDKKKSAISVWQTNRTAQSSRIEEVVKSLDVKRPEQRKTLQSSTITRKQPPTTASRPVGQCSAARTITKLYKSMRRGPISGLISTEHEVG